MNDLDQLRRDARGFKGRFAFQAEHTEDRGVGNIADFVEVDDRLVFIRPDDEGDPEEWHVIAEPIEQHIAEPIARMLNAVGPLLDEVESLRARLRDEFAAGAEYQRQAAIAQAEADAAR